MSAVLVAACESRALEQLETSAVRACIRSVACEIKSYPQVAHCLDDLRVRISPAMRAVLASIYHCVNSARTCDEVQSCYGMKDQCDQTFVASCDGQLATTCDLITHNQFQYDCGAVGSSCAIDEEHTFSAECEGDPTIMDYLTIFVAECTDEACQIGDACEEVNLSSCDGDRLQICLDGRWVSYDCGALHLGPCQMKGNDWGSCTSP